jgi:hypothetical protein
MDIMESIVATVSIYLTDKVVLHCLRRKTVQHLICISAKERLLKAAVSTKRPIMAIPSRG